MASDIPTLTADIPTLADAHVAARPALRASARTGALARPLVPRKPLLDIPAQIAQLKSRGVTFALCSETEAADFLANANNYLRTRSYRTLYPRRPDGTYIGLDFGALKGLSSADRKLRAALRDISIDVEHFARVRLLKHVEEHGEDGYVVTQDYLGSFRSDMRRRIRTSLINRADQGSDCYDEYAGELIAHNLADMPVWVFLEVVDFGRFADFWLFCARRWNDEELLKSHYPLRSVKNLRNATSHNSCILNGFSPTASKANFVVREPIASAMTQAGLKNTKSRRAKMANLRIAQIAETLWASHEFCTRKNTRLRHATAAGDVVAVFQSIRPLCPADGSLASFFDFIGQLVDIWLPLQP